MKIVTVYLDDYDKPLVGRAVVNDDITLAVVEELQKIAGKDYIVEVTTPDTVEYILGELRDMTKEECEDGG